MRRLGSLSGRGRLLVKSKEPADVDYRLDVFEDTPGGLKSARGSLNGNMIDLFAALEAQGATLELEDGGTVTVLVNHADSSDFATFVVNGPVPGF